MDLDARKPVIVILGAWNPAIFQPGWIARYLFEYPEGQPVDVTTMFSGGPEPGLTFYLEDVGISANGQRLMIYANGDSPSVFGRAEQVAARVLERLPHTPLGGYGINFSFIEASTDDKLIDQLKGRDDLARYNVTKQRYAATIQLKEGPELNFTRYYESRTVGFEFNFHLPKITAPDAAKELSGSIQRRFEYATAMLNELYGLRCTGVQLHVLQSGPKGVEG